MAVGNGDRPVATVGVLVTGKATLSPVPARDMRQWEYKIVELSGGGLFGGGEEPTEASLDELGAEGWELAAALTGSSRSLGGRPKSETDALVFKRPRE
jgi:hypothetical protein